MGSMILTYKIMPSSPDVSFEQMIQKINDFLKQYDSKVAKQEIEPIAFGLKALKITFVVNESINNTDVFEEFFAKLPGVESVELVFMDRALG